MRGSQRVTITLLFVPFGNKSNNSQVLAEGGGGGGAETQGLVSRPTGSGSSAEALPSMYSPKARPRPRPLGPTPLGGQWKCPTCQLSPSQHLFPSLPRDSAGDSFLPTSTSLLVTSLVLTQSGVNTEEAAKPWGHRLPQQVPHQQPTPWLLSSPQSGSQRPERVSRDQPSPGQISQAQARSAQPRTEFPKYLCSTPSLPDTPAGK